MECYIVCVCCVDTLTAKPQTVSQRQFYPTSYFDIIFNCTMSDNNEGGRAIRLYSLRVANTLPAHAAVILGLDESM